MKNKKPIFITVFSGIIVVILGIGLYFFNSETIYSVEDVLEGVDFSAAGPSVELKKIDEEANIIPIELTEKTQQELIKAFEKLKFKKADSQRISKDYLMNITWNRGYFMFLDEKGIIVDDGQSYTKYIVEGDRKFFSIMEKVATE
jgi:hypothetical protein